MTPAPRVLMISKACIVGIYQRKLEQIARHGIELRVIVPPSWHDERGILRLERAYTEGYQLETLPLRFNGNYHLHFYAGLKQQIAAFQPDILHIDEEPYNLATWQALYHARPQGIKTLFFSWQNLNRDYPPPFNWGERWVLRNIDYAIVGTESAGDVWRQKGYTGPLAVIPQFGTDPALFQPATSRPERPFTIGFIGRLVEEKGAHSLLEAAARLPFDWRLRLLSGGPLLSKLQAHTHTLGIADCVTFDGQIPSAEMPDYYRGLDVLVLPSLTRPHWKEQFGRVLIEAMASGVPVIGSNSGAIPDVIGSAGLIFPEGDAVALAEQLSRLYHDTDLYTGLQCDGRSRVLEHFTQEQVAAATVRIYQELHNAPAR